MHISSNSSRLLAHDVTRSRQRAIPLLFGASSLLIGFFFMRPNMGEPDSYREVLSALQYLDSHSYGSYWDHPLTMYVFVAAARFARAFGMNRIAVVNTLAVVLGSISVWPFYQFVQKLVNRQTAVFASAALILSPSFIRFSTYLSHEITGFTLAAWSLWLLQKTIEERNRAWAPAFGFCLAAAWAARPNGVIFLSLPLLIFSIHESARTDLATSFRLFFFSLLGFCACLLLVYRPSLVVHLISKSGNFFFTFYELGRYMGSTTQIALQSLAPALVVLSAAGCVGLLVRKKYFIPLFAGAWILVAYAFYTGMYSMHRYFIVLLPPCLILCFAGADAFDTLLGPLRMRHAAKASALLLLVFASLGPNLPELLYLRNVDDDKVASEAIGKLVGRDLLFTTADEPMIIYYNRESPPETVYLVTEYTPGRLTMRADALRLAQERLKSGLPVFATEEIIQQLQYVGIEIKFQLVWEYKRMRLYRLTSLRMS